MKKAIYIVLAYLMVSCGDVSVESALVCPQSFFIQKFPKREINLTNVLGDRFGILSSTDTISYSIKYDKKTHFNLIQNSTNHDTIFFGKVSRYRGLFFLSQQYSDSTWHIQAIKIKDDLIYGFNSMHQQMCWIDELVGPDYPVIEGYKRPDITVDKDYSYKLTPNKKPMKDLYSELLTRSSPDTLVELNWLTDKPIYYDTKELIEESDNSNSSDLLIYPNPFSNTINITFNSKNSYKCEIIDLNGERVDQNEFRGFKNQWDLSHLSTGVFILRIIDSDFNSITTKIKKE